MGCYEAGIQSGGERVRRVHDRLNSFDSSRANCTRILEQQTMGCKTKGKLQPVSGGGQEFAMICSALE